MAKKPDTPCARCGKLLWSGPTSLPVGERKCRTCRAEARAQRAVTPKVRPPRPSRRWRCEVCGCDYRRTYNKQRTCGRACGILLRRSIVRRKVCIHCGATFEENAVGGGRLVCGHRCPALPKPVDRQVECRVCGTLSKTVTCSVKCQQEAKRRHDREYSQGRRASGPRHCEGCGAGVSRPRKRCDTCIRATKRQRKRRRRALKLGVATERYTLAEIATRDRHRCGLCRKRVAMTKSVPHPKAPTIDHVVPFADGGDDTRANVQLAHFECNWMKRDGGTQQLALVG